MEVKNLLLNSDIYILLFLKPLKASIKKSHAATFGHLTLTVQVVTCVMLVVTKAAIEMEVSFKWAGNFRPEKIKF